MPPLSPYQERQVRDVLERQAKGDRTSRFLGFDKRSRPVLQVPARGKLKVYAVLRNGAPTAVTGEPSNPCIYTTTRTRYQIPHYILNYKAAPGYGAQDTFRDLDDAIARLVMA